MRVARGRPVALRRAPLVESQSAAEGHLNTAQQRDRLPLGGLCSWCLLVGAARDVPQASADRNSAGTQTARRCTFSRVNQFAPLAVGRVGCCSSGKNSNKHAF
eukprot:6441491-Prymnesium_polylepis.3